jgi:hypothetical protein
VRLHAYCVLSNHFHLVVTDPQARLPAFEQYLDSLVARALNASLGRWESFWAPASYSAVALQSPADIIDKAAYVLANPVAAGLVPRGRDWPGLWSDPQRVGRGALEVERPSVFFRTVGGMPETISLELTPPPGFKAPEDFQSQLTAALTAREQQAALEFSSERRAFIGEKRVLSQNPRVHPSPGEPRRKLKPRVAARDKWKRIEALCRLREFLRAYRQAWAALKAGLRDTVFPAGTYWLRVAHGVRCAAT